MVGVWPIYRRRKSSTSNVRLSLCKEGEIFGCALGQFYLGGPTTLRGYDVGAPEGAEGNLATIEYRHDLFIPLLPGTWQFSLFADSG